LVLGWKVTEAATFLAALAGLGTGIYNIIVTNAISKKDLLATIWKDYQDYPVRLN
jgi:hypothetical protein